MQQENLNYVDQKIFLRISNWNCNDAKYFIHKIQCSGFLAFKIKSNDYKQAEISKSEENLTNCIEDSGNNQW